MPLDYERRRIELNIKTIEPRRQDQPEASRRLEHGHGGKEAAV
ncbi:hypothetical protein [Novipirellula sp.]